MKAAIPVTALILVLAARAQDDRELAEKISRHQEGASRLSIEQDELAADVQQLTIEQTMPAVIELFREVETAMDDASILLYEHDTGGETIAAETEVIQKIYEAARERQQRSGGQSEAGGAMLEMMERMMGEGEGQQEGQGSGEKPGSQGGEGNTGDSESANEDVDGAGEGRTEERTVPKGAGQAGRSLPREFRDALDAYNRGAEELTR